MESGGIKTVNLKKRHPEINGKRAIHFDSKCGDWCTSENFEKVYRGGICSYG
jgi:hypothetical protein